MSHLRIVQQLIDAEPVEYSKFGIIGDGKTYEKPGMPDLTDALATYEVVQLDGRPQMLLGETFRLTNFESVCLTSGRTPNVQHRDSWPGFLWDGPKGGTIIELDRCRNVTLDGFGVATDDFFRVKAPAGTGISLDGGKDTNPDEPNVFGTSNTLSRMRHLTYPGPLDIEADFIANSLRTKWNQEKHRFPDCGGNGNGRGSFFRNGPSYNAKNILIENARYISNYRKAVRVDNGSVKLRHCDMSFNEWDIYAGASTGYITEEHHIGEGSTHHAFINCPYHALWGTYDHSRTRPRSAGMPDLPVPNDEVGLVYEEAWIMFGGQAADVAMERFYIGSPPSPDTKVFGWMNDRSFGRYELGPGWIGRGHTKRTLGIDTPTLRKIAGKPKIVFHNRAAGTNPGGPGITDLAGGELVLNSSGTMYVP